MISPHAGAATIASNTMLMEENQVLKKRNAEMLRENQQQRQRILQLLKNIDEVRNSFTLLVHAECAPLDTGSQDIETGKGLGVDGSNGAGSRKEEETLLRGDWNDDIGLTGRCLDEIDSQDAGSEKEETSGSCSIADESAAAQIHQRHMQLHVTDTCN